MKACVMTLGCRVNQSESAIIEASLKENDVTIVNLSDNPDYFILNTCTVTAKSDYNARQLIRRAARAGAKVIVTGCYSQLRKDEVENLPGVFKIVDINKKNEIVGIVTGKYLRENDLIYRNYSHSRPYLKIQDGCNFRCTYCSVPLARGRSRSISPEEVMRRIYDIEEGGYNEVVLTGIHLGSYGHDLPERERLSSLILKIIKKTNIHRIRLSSIEINEIDDDLLDIFKSTRLCNHLHIPLQSGSNRILSLMRRNYTADLFYKKIMKIYERYENICIGTDVIVGFPAESEDDFKQTYELIKSLPFAYLHVFPFSPRPGTEAAEMKDISSQIKKERLNIIRHLGNNKKNDYMIRQNGKILEVVVEDIIENDNITGTSNNYMKVLASLKWARKGSVLYIRSSGVKKGYIIGDVIQ